MNENPLVTVYIPTYNRLELLKRAVKSVLDQDYSNIELIVVDDGSSDGTVDYLECVSQADQRVRYFVNEVNSGACVSRNKAIWAAKGEFITGLDDDDYFLNDRISCFVKYWHKKNKKSVALYSNSVFLLKDEKIKKTRRPKYTKARDLIDSNYIGNQIFIKTEDLIKIGGFDESFPAWQDLECWYRLLNVTGEVAENIGCASYITDMRHPHERISDNKLSQVYDAYELFVKKYNLILREKVIFKMQIYAYVNTDCSIGGAFNRLKANISIRNLYSFLKRLFYFQGS